MENKLNEQRKQEANSAKELILKLKFKQERAREKKAVKEVLQVLAANNLTANEINTVIGQVHEVFLMRPMTQEFVEEYFKNESKFRACFFVK